MSRRRNCRRTCPKCRQSRSRSCAHEAENGLRDRPNALRMAASQGKSPPSGFADSPRALAIELHMECGEATPWNKPKGGGREREREGERHSAYPHTHTQNKKGNKGSIRKVNKGYSCPTRALHDTAAISFFGLRLPSCKLLSRSSAWSAVAQALNDSCTQTFVELGEQFLPQDDMATFLPSFLAKVHCCLCAGRAGFAVQRPRVAAPTVAPGRW